MCGPIDMKRIALAIATVFTAAAPAVFAQYSQSDRYDSRYDKRDYGNDNRRPDSGRVIESRPVYAEEAREECYNNRTRRYEALRDRGYMLDRSRCRVSRYGGEIVGYDVRYEYQGREFTTRMTSDPGRRVVVGREINSNGVPLDSMGRDLDPNHSGG